MTVTILRLTLLAVVLGVLNQAQPTGTLSTGGVTGFKRPNPDLPPQAFLTLDDNPYKRPNLRANPLDEYDSSKPPSDVLKEAPNRSSDWYSGIDDHPFGQFLVEEPLSSQPPPSEHGSPSAIEYISQVKAQQLTNTYGLNKDLSLSEAYRESLLNKYQQSFSDLLTQCDKLKRDLYSEYRTSNARTHMPAFHPTGDEASKIRSAINDLNRLDRQKQIERNLKFVKSELVALVNGSKLVLLLPSPTSTVGLLNPIWPYSKVDGEYQLQCDVLVKNLSRLDTSVYPSVVESKSYYQVIQ